MKAAIYHAPGAPSVLHYEDVPDPSMGKDQLLIRVEAISIEGGDLVNRRITQPENPNVPLGYAAAGEIVEIGEAVQGFEVGQKVATFAFLGSHAEYRAVRAATSWHVPDGLDMGIAAAVPCGPGTAALALQMGRLQKGQTVLVQGAAGGVGIATVQLASKAGARVMGTGTNIDALERLRAFGLQDAIVVGDGSVPDQVLALTQGKGVDLVIDNIGGPAVTEGLHACRPGGTVVLVGVLGGREERIDPWYLLRQRKTLMGCLLGAVMDEPDVHALIAGLLQDAMTGALSVPIDRSFPLSEAAAAHAYAETRGRIGRVILRP